MRDEIIKQCLEKGKETKDSAHGIGYAYGIYYYLLCCDELLMNGQLI